MKAIKDSLIASLLLSGSACVWAYELATHGRITHEAFNRSVLYSDPNDADGPKYLEGTLGIKDGSSPFGIRYYDVLGVDVEERLRHVFEQSKLRMPGGVEPLSVEGWLIRGAIREDDYHGGENPRDDPYGQSAGDPNYQLLRVLHHFFDPVNDMPLTVPFVGLLDSDIHTAPAWALGTTNAEVFTQPNNAETARRNHFTILDAREAMWRALTGRTRDGVNAAPGATNEAPAPESVRKAYWATTFRALGDVVHLIQDMAQSQQARCLV